jgi:N-acetylglucosaminyl-diphospho-decaprenol L-rhamnosyltransferase
MARDQLADQSIDLSIIVVAWNVKELVDECFKAIRASDDSLKKEILFVDNASKDGTAEYVESNFPEATLIRSDRNLGFIGANNLAYRRARGKYILMLNSDAFVFKETLRISVEYMERHPEAGVLGARLIGRDGVLQLSARYFPTPARSFLNRIGLLGKLPFIRPLDDLSWDHKTVRECDWVVGCYLLARKDLIDRTGFFLREDYFMYNDDNDLCLRIKRLGYKVVFFPTDVIHLGGATAKKMTKVTADSQVESLQIESQAIYYRKNYSLATACRNLMLMLLYDCLKAAKHYALGTRSAGREYREHMKATLAIYRGTGFGQRAITK